MHQKDKIVHQAKSLFMRYGIKSITMDEVAREMGISKKTLYQFVDNKKDLINQVIMDYIETERAAIVETKKDAIDAVHEMLLIAKHVTQLLRETQPSVSYDLQKYYKESWALLESFHHVQIYDMIKENLEWGIKDGFYRKEINSDIIAKLYVGKTTLIIDEALFPLKKYNKENLYKAFIYYHIHGIITVKGGLLLKKYQQLEAKLDK